MEKGNTKAWVRQFSGGAEYSETFEGDEVPENWVSEKRGNICVMVNNEWKGYNRESRSITDIPTKLQEAANSIWEVRNKISKA